MLVHPRGLTPNARASLVALVLIAPYVAGFTLPVASAQLPVPNPAEQPDYRIDEYTVGHVIGVNDTFVSGQTAIYVWVNLSNRGFTHPGNVPLVAFAKSRATPPVIPDSAVACKAVKLDRGQHGITHTLTIRVPTTAAELGSTWDVRVVVNHPWADIPRSQISNSACKNLEPQEETSAVCPETPPTQLGEPVSCPDSRGLADNSMKRTVIADKRLNFRIPTFDACRGDSTEADCKSIHLPSGGAPENVVAYKAGTQLRVRYRIENGGGTYTSDLDPNTGVSWRPRTRVVATNVNASSESVVVLNETRPVSASNSMVNFSLEGRAGHYALRIVVDPDNAFPEHVESDNARTTMNLSVRAPNLVTSAGGDLLKHGTTGTAYTYRNQLATVSFSMAVRNVADHAAKNTSASPSPPFFLRAYVDEITADSDEDHAIYNRTISDLDAGKSVSFDHEFQGYDPALASPPADAKRLAPGKHKLIVVVDPPCENALADPCTRRGRVYEGNETDNVHTFTFYVEDKRPPTVVNFTAIREDPDPAKFVETEFTPDAGTGVDLTVNKSEKISFRVNATDDDAAGLNVTFEHRLPNGTTVPPKAMTKWRSGASGKWTHVYNETFREEGTHTLFVVANDSANNAAESKKFQLSVKKWSIQTKSEAALVKAAPDDNETVAYSESGVVEFEVEVNATETGVYPEQTSSNKIIKVWYPRDPTPLEDTMTAYLYDSACDDPPPLPLPGQPSLSCVSNRFRYTVQATHVGRHNVSVMIRDAAGDIRYFNRTFVVNGTKPTIVSTSDLPAGIEAGAGLNNVTVHAKDIFGVRDAFLNFSSRTSAYSRNITLKRTNGTEFDGEWSINVTTGFGKDVDHGGAFNVTYAVVNVNGDWNRTSDLLSINDTLAPTLGVPALSRNPQEIGADVTWTVNATDATWFEVTLTIKRGTSEVIESVKMARVGTTNGYSFTRAFDASGEYAWTIEAKDSVGLRAPPRNGGLTVARNLAPEITIRTPSFVTGGIRYSSANFKLQAFIEDRDEVVRDSIAATASLAKGAAAPVEFPLADPEIVTSASPKGFVAVWLPGPGATRLTHGSTVHFVINATDKSGQALTRSLNGSVRIDDRAPTSARAPTFVGPQHAFFETDPLNVSLTTEIQLAATDGTDEADSGFRQIQMNVLGTATSDTFPYSASEPLTLGRILKPVFTDGPIVSGEYIVQYWATDNVGNRESPPKQYAVILDNDSPNPDFFLTRPQGRDIASPWSDEHSGMDRVIAVYAVGGGLPQTLELEDRSGVWTGSIPAGVRGERVCYYLLGFDKVQNSFSYGNQSKPFHCYDVSNRLPSVTITEPGDKAVVSKVVTVRWRATDPDNESLSYTVKTRLVGAPNARDLTRITDGSTSFALNTLELPDGTYVLVVEADDGKLVGADEITIVVQNRETAIGNVTIDQATIRPGRSFVVTAEVGRAGVVVKALLLRGDEVVATVEMHDDGKDPDAAPNDRIYSARLTAPREGGAYSIKVVAEYKDGGETKTEELAKPGAITVKFTAADVFTDNWPIWTALVAFFVACVGVGGYALYRRWQA